MQKYIFFTLNKKKNICKFIFRKIYKREKAQGTDCLTPVLGIIYFSSKRRAVSCVNIIKDFNNINFISFSVNNHKL